MFRYEDLNLKGWPWETYDYVCRSIRDMYFHLFLGYKVERRIVPGAESDTHFALTAISGRPLPLADLRVEVEQAKGQYLRENHGAGLTRAGLVEMSDDELAATLEVGDADAGKVTRLLAALEFRPEEGLLKLMTLY